MNAKKQKISVAEYLTQQIAVSGVSQKNLADQLGYDKPNIITMFKQGKTKVPLNKIAPIAKILGIDRVNFLRLALTEYNKEMWEVLEEILGQRIVSDSELLIIEMIREASRGREIFPKNEEQQQQLKNLISTWAKGDEAAAKAAVKALEKRKPKHAPAEDADEDDAEIEQTEAEQAAE